MPEKPQWIQQLEFYSYDTVMPSEILFDMDLKPNEKILYLLIRCMANHKGYAFPKNARIQEFFGGISEDTVSRMLRQLETAGAIRIEHGQGGRGLRKIFVGEVYRRNLRTGAEVNLRTDAEVTNIGIKDKKKKEKKHSSDAAAVSQEDVIQWLNAWVARQDLSLDMSTRLCNELRDFVETRMRNRKAVNTIPTVIRLTNRLVRFGTCVSHPVQLWVYMLGRSIANNWSDVFAPEKLSDKLDFVSYLASDYGIKVTVDEEFPDPAKAAKEEDFEPDYF